jgi:hypothetical protein
VKTGFCGNKNATLTESEHQQFSFDDNVFAILDGEPQLKSTAGYCGQEEQAFSFPSSIAAKCDYNKYGIYNTLVAKIFSEDNRQVFLFRQETVDTPLDQTPTDVPKDGHPITSRCFFKRDYYQNNIVYDRSANNPTELEVRPYINTRRLVGFRLDVIFYWQFFSNSTINSARIMIECHQY